MQMGRVNDLSRMRFWCHARRDCRQMSRPRLSLQLMIAMVRPLSIQHEMKRKRNTSQVSRADCLCQAIVQHCIQVFRNGSAPVTSSSYAIMSSSRSTTCEMWCCNGESSSDQKMSSTIEVISCSAAQASQSTSYAADRAENAPPMKPITSQTSSTTRCCHNPLCLASTSPSSSSKQSVAISD